MDIIQRVNWVDVLVVILMLRMSYVAFQEGLSHVIFPTIAVLLVIIISLHYYQKIGSILSQNLVNIPIEVSFFLSFFTFVIIISLIFKLLRVILDKIIRVEWHPFVERFGGLIVGIVRASLIVSLVLTAIVLVPIRYFQWSIRDRSVTGMHFLRIGPNVYDKVSAFLPTVKIGGSEVKREDLINSLVSDKSIGKKAKRKDTKTAEWEKE